MSDTCTLVPGTRCDNCEAQLWPDEGAAHVHLTEEDQDTGEIMWLCHDCFHDLLEEEGHNMTLGPADD